VTKDGFLTAWGIPPGVQRTPVVVAYALPYTTQLRYETRAPYPVQNVNVAMAQQGVTLTAPSLKDQGLQTDQNGTSYRIYTGTALAAGQALAFDLQGLPKIGAPKQSTPAPGSGAVTLVTPAAGGSIWDDKRVAGGALAGAGLLVVLVALLWYVMTRGRRKAGAASEHRTLYEAIADLDEEHEAGGIGDEEYAEQRQLLKEALLAAMEDEPQAAELVPDGLA
jgi:cytochrome c-type biogenesis protein CcmI